MSFVGLSDWRSEDVWRNRMQEMRICVLQTYAFAPKWYDWDTSQTAHGSILHHICVCVCLGVKVELGRGETGGGEFTHFEPLSEDWNPKPVKEIRVPLNCHSHIKFYNALYTLSNLLWRMEKEFPQRQGQVCYLRKTNCYTAVIHCYSVIYSA